MNKKILALAAMNLALAGSDSSSIPYVPEPKATNPNPYRHKQCKSCKSFKHCYINLIHGVNHKSGKTYILPVVGGSAV